MVNSSKGPQRSSRRDFLKLVAGGAVSLPVAAWLALPSGAGANESLLVAGLKLNPKPPSSRSRTTPTPTPRATATPTPVPTSTPTPTPTPTPEPEPEPAPELAPEAPARSIQSLVDAAAPGSTVVVPPGIYRETVTITKPLTLAGEPGAEIRGSDVWTDWTRQGSYWVRGGLPALPGIDAPGLADSGGRQNWPHQVFFDGRPLLQVASDPASGQFAVRGDRVILADDPNGHLVEVTTREYWVVGRAGNVTIQGFTMKHAGNRPQTGAISNGGHSNWTIRDCVLSDAHGAVVSLVAASGLRLLNNDISRGGQLGVHGWNATDVLVQGNRIHDNNTERFSYSWEAGGLKMCEMTRLTLDGNEVWGNGGPGLWCDIDCRDTTISNNRVHHNLVYGINYEISRSAKIFGNAVWENGWGFHDWGWGAGILVQNSADTEVFANVVAWNADGISVITQARGDSPPVTGNQVHDNTICIVATGTPNVFALAWLEDWQGDIAAPRSRNTGANNAFWHANPDGAPWPFIWGREAYPYDQLSRFAATPGNRGGRYLSPREKDQILTAAGVPLAPERG